jgi:hypothetical protein
MNWSRPDATLTAQTNLAPAKAEPTLAVLALLIAVWGGNGSARADEILIGTEKRQQVEVVGFSAGLVEFRSAHRFPDELPISQIDYLFIDSVPAMQDFNEAEEYLLKQQPRQAVTRYTRALRSAGGFWQRLVRARLLMAADRAELLEKAVLAFLDLVRHDLAAAADLIPQSLPRQRSDAVQRTLRRIERAVHDQVESDARTAVELLSYALLRSLADPAADPLASKLAFRPLPARLRTQRAYAIKIDAIERILQTGQDAEAARAAEACVAQVPEAQLPRVLLLAARAQLAAASTEREWLAAATMAMRVVVHFPESGEAAAGLLLAAAAHEKLGHSADAVRLVRECRRNHQLTNRQKEQADQMLARLTHSAGS